MKDGHPHLTEGLDLKRAKQRRKLRSIPDWLLDRDRFGPAPTVKIEGISDPHYAESLVRQLADEHLEVLSGLLATWEAEMDSERLVRFIGKEVEADPNPRLKDARTELIDTTHTRRQGLTETRELPQQYSAPLAQAVLLLSWADELADDGYTDPRLAQTRQ